MHSLDIMKEACTAALAADEEGWNWQIEYTEVVDPQSVIELIEAARRQVEADNAEETGSDKGISDEELAAMAKVIRDLCGYLRYTAGDKPDPVREDLVQHANQLLGLAGL